MDALRKTDHIAYIRFASVYRPFTDIESLKEAVTALEEGRVPTVDEKTMQLRCRGRARRGAPPAPATSRRGFPARRLHRPGGHLRRSGRFTP
jgi:hypothetical protein